MSDRDTAHRCRWCVSGSAAAKRLTQWADELTDTNDRIK